MSVLSEELLYHAAVAGDYGLRTGLSTMLTLAIASGVAGDRWRRERERLEFYAELAANRPEREAVFSAPHRTEVRTTGGRNPGIEGGRVELLGFDSSYVALNPALRSEYAHHVNNQRARAQHWRHDAPARGTLCVIHGFGASPAWLNTAFFSLKDFFADGWDIVLFTLPFHGSRRSDGTPFNGIELFAYGLSVFSEAILHAIHDFRALLDHLEAQGAMNIGVTGLSLGGYTCALAAAADARLAFAIPNAAVTWVPPLLRSWFPANVAGTMLRALTGVTEELLELALGLHSPLSWAPVLPRDRLLIVAGRGDRLAPPEQSLLLWEHWGRPELRWFPGSHVLHFGRGDYLRAMRALMERSEQAAAA